MARTWTLAQALSIASGGQLTSSARMLTNGAGTEAYFIVNVSSGDNKIYKWLGGATLTDISGTTFPSSSGTFAIEDLCVFNGELFVAYGQRPLIGSTDIYKYNSGTSWTNEYTLRDETDSFDGWIGGGIGGVDETVWPMDCDASYMAIAGTISSTNTETWRRMWVRDTAGNYSITQMPSTAYSAPGYQLVGLSKGSDYGKVYGFDRITSTNYRPIERNGSWAYAAAAIGAKIPIGYGDGKSFFSHNTSGTTWELKYSTDFGVNLVAAGGLTQDGSERSRWRFKNLGGGVIMLSAHTNQAYTWDAATDTFVADGTVTPTPIYDYFILNGILYAFANGSSADTIEIWTAGATGSSGFYYGRAGLQYRAALPFPVIGVGALSVAYPMAFLGSGAAAAQMVAYAQPADSYASFTDFTGALSDDPIVAFDSTPWGDAAGAAESGEDSGPGGGLSNGKC